MKIANVAAAALLTLVPLSALAGMTKELREWAGGPEKWIMTRDEQRAWEQVDTDDEAVAFIDLFWARRDPSVGTPANEFRQEFTNRVAKADRIFKHRMGGGRGSLTDRGRFYVMLGPATTSSEQQRNSTQGMGMQKDASIQQVAGKLDPQAAPTGDITSSRSMGARDVWEWSHADAQKFDVPRLEVVFVEDAVTGNFKRDTQRNEVMAALPVAIERAIVSPQMTELPSWAMRGGLEPYHTTVTLEKPKAAPVELTRGEMGATDFALEQSRESLGWTGRYCGAGDTQTLNVGLRITGLIGGQKLTMVADPDEMTPERIKSTENCYLVRGSVPLTEMTPGQYEIEVTIADPASGRSYNLQSKFKIE